MTPSPAQEQMDALKGCEPALLADYMVAEGNAGSFFRAISVALRRADPVNRFKLYQAFTDPLYGYLIRQRLWAEKNGWESA